MFYLHLSKTRFALALCSTFLVGCVSQPKLTPLKSAAAVRSSEFRGSMGSLISPGFVEGNRVETLNNGAAIFPAMLASIQNAKKTINFETFVFYNGEVPKQFAEALQERARAGVKVRVILDGVGALKSRPLWEEMKNAGVKLQIYRPVMGVTFLRSNHRTHRKLLIVDGREAFIGGVGIADDWKGNGASAKEWHDLHFRVKGLVVNQLQAAFCDHWYDTSHEVLQGPDFFPLQKNAGPATARCFISAPVKNRSSAEWMYHLVIASARETLFIENAYFVPNTSLVDALCAAAQRGVKVTIILPGEHIDQKSVRRASRKRWPKLLAAGVEIYEYQPSMAHTKLLIADGLFVSVGSTNFDPRSLWINDEANLDILDAGTAAQLTRVFQQDLKKSAKVLDAGHSVKTIHTVPISVAEAPLESQL